MTKKPQWVRDNYNHKARAHIDSGKAFTFHHKSAFVLDGEIFEPIIIFDSDLHADGFESLLALAREEATRNPEFRSALRLMGEEI